jgi:hypothetical protein
MENEVYFFASPTKYAARNQNSYLQYFINTYTGCPRMNQHNFNQELLASCRTRKKYLKNSMSKNKMTFNF